MNLPESKSLFAERVFTPGQRIRAVASHAHVLTEGKEYTVQKYEPSHASEVSGFRWPAYVTVLGDDGQSCVAHTYRFIGKDD